MGELVKKFIAGSVTASIFKNTSEKGDYYSIIVEKIYKNDMGEWHTTSTFNNRDLPNLMLVTQKAYEFVMLK